jgi:hypothetical protein
LAAAECVTEIAPERIVEAWMRVGGKWRTEVAA